MSAINAVIKDQGLTTRVHLLLYATTNTTPKETTLLN
jgi:hypothetical protein